LTYWTTTYSQLFVCRIFTGVSIGGSVPCIFSLLGDLYPVNERIFVSTWVGISMSLGIAGGQGLIIIIVFIIIIIILLLLSLSLLYISLSYFYLITVKVLQDYFHKVMDGGILS